ncbi:formylglycine-generating enzyme family protein [Spirosoma sp. KNUC1025]|uniref:formylglycine-generating enzyme family protein n=1 Tax=Spirosoma sp. KNUC1025 TaxID=2894082 RepID=UPI00386502CC|nr:formylglycine-generating enzyme family protein [Spirosoma sp. KNUC1025]
MKLLIPVLALVLVSSFMQKNVVMDNVPEAEDRKSISLCEGPLCKIPSRAAVLRSGSLAKPENRSETAEMVLIQGGNFQMGAADFPDARPIHGVTVNSFWMDRHEVTNAQFAAFVKATGYVTVAERPLNPADFPGVPADKLVPGSAVFTPPTQAVSLQNPVQWWQYVAGTNWRHPLGPKSSIVGKDSEPVVQVCYDDAVAYARWAGKRLPTEAEWEFAARAGRKAAKYYWGNELKPRGKWAANIFQGNFPNANTAEDGFRTTAPVQTYSANAYGLYDMEGNVWEWCSDLYRPDYYQKSPVNNPKGPGNSYDPDEPGTIKHVQRGGSFLCSDQYCVRYQAGSRGKGETTSASNNLGFRCVRSVL